MFLYFAVALLSVAVAGSVNSASGDVSEGVMLLHRRSAVAASQPIEDACGCTVGLDGWSTTRSGGCHPEAQTSAEEAAGCQANVAPDRVWDDCGCTVGEEGWSRTKVGCQTGFVTGFAEALACNTPPSPVPPTPIPTKAGSAEACLCVFDIDRTLTGKQGDDRKCPNNRVLNEMQDHGYGGGPVTLSALSAAGLSGTFCSSCFLGVCSAGHGSGEASPWNAYILNHILRSNPQDNLTASLSGIKKWSYGTDVRSPYVLGQGNRHKQDAVEGIREWYGRQSVFIAPEDVFFFGDRTENIQPFKQKGFNSLEISCSSRDRNTDGGIGYCGATPDEIQRTHGNFVCSDLA